jgi:type II secretory pathway pseudopilin PulG
MTLLEALVALVILGLSAVGFLEAFQGTSRATRDAETWVQAVGYAEAAMERTKLGGGAAGAPFPDALPPGFARRVDVRPWPGAAGVAEVTVTIALPGGGAFVLHRLVRSP